jgi:hypothetical protein
MSFRDLVVPEIKNVMENLKVGTIFSAYDSQFLLKDYNNNWVSPSYAVYLGELFEETENLVNQNIPNINIYLFLVVLKNGDTVFWTTTNINIKKYLELGWFKKTNRKLIPNEILQQIRLPKEKELVEIVGNETPVQLPPTIKNELLVLLGQPKNTDFFPNEKGGKKNKPKKSRKYKKRQNIKSRKIRFR